MKTARSRSTRRLLTTLSLLPSLAFAQAPTDETTTSPPLAASAAAPPPAPPASATLATPAPTTQPRRPWRAHEAVGLAWLRFGLEHRIRFEHLENDFRTVNPGDATALSLRTLVSAELRVLPFVAGAELQDARMWASATTPLNTTQVDAMELLQGYVGLRGEDVLADGDAASLTAGRMTLDLGSRRLVARNEFRNTINAFTGLDLEWTSRAGEVVRAFAVMPVLRLPTDPAALADDRIAFDRENPAAVLWALFFQSRPLAGATTIDTSLLGLHERDADLAPSSNRRLVTLDLRALRAPSPGAFDYQIELVAQLGRSHASAAASDTTDLAHRAFALHASAGYRFDVAWAPRLVLQYDHASGDRSPNDDVNGRFDPLFGARRFDLGPTGLYGAVARSNAMSPALRFEARPHRTVDAFAAYRLLWLASPRDAWTSAALRDATGDSGRMVGQQVEGRLRWHALPRNLSFDVGGAVFVRGAFAKHAPGAEASPSLYVYTQLTGWI